MTILGMSKQMMFTVFIFGTALILATGCGKPPTSTFETSFYRTQSSLQYFADGTYVAAVADPNGVGVTQQGTYKLVTNVYEMTAQDGSTSECVFIDNKNGTANVSCTNSDITPDNLDVFKYQVITSVK